MLHAYGMGHTWPTIRFKVRCVQRLYLFFLVLFESLLMNRSDVERGTNETLVDLRICLSAAALLFVENKLSKCQFYEQN